MQVKLMEAELLQCIEREKAELQQKIERLTTENAAQQETIHILLI